MILEVAEPCVAGVALGLGVPGPDVGVHQPGAVIDRGAQGGGPPRCGSVVRGSPQGWCPRAGMATRNFMSTCTSSPGRPADSAGRTLR